MQLHSSGRCIDTIVMIGCNNVFYSVNCQLAVTLNIYKGVFTIFVYTSRINETLKSRQVGIPRIRTGAVGNRTYRAGESVYLFFEFTVYTTVGNFYSVNFNTHLTELF